MTSNLYGRTLPLSDVFVNSNLRITCKKLVGLHYMTYSPNGHIGQCGHMVQYPTAEAKTFRRLQLRNITHDAFCLSLRYGRQQTSDVFQALLGICDV